MPTPAIRGAGADKRRPYPRSPLFQLLTAISPANAADFHRDRIVVLDITSPADGGNSSWTPLPDGRIVILDYTSAPSLASFASGRGAPPIIRAYLVTKKDLTR